MVLAKTRSERTRGAWGCYNPGREARIDCGLSHDRRTHLWNLNEGKRDYLPFGEGNRKVGSSKRDSAPQITAKRNARFKWARGESPHKGREDSAAGIFQDSVA